jgi:histidinol phosphatase-like PHP family hydrolase
MAVAAVRLLSNSDIAELLVTAAEDATGMRQKALKRASRSAFFWPEEAADLVASGRSLQELHSVGPFIARLIEDWVKDPPPLADACDPLRHDFLTLAEARRLLAAHPSWSAKTRGDFHMHTSWSDGSGSVSEMTAAGQARGYEYIAIADHAKGLKIAGGIDEAQLAEQAEEIAAVNACHPSFRVLRNLELNLNPKGEGDMAPESLAELDLVIGSFHSALRVKDDQTERYLAALRNPTIQILGHPRGRVYNFRLGLSADWPRVFAEATALGKALEINCYPDRQDLNVELLELARAAGTYISLGTDSHHASQLGFIELGLAATLRAGIPAERIVNFMPLDELRAWITRVREG